MDEIIFKDAKVQKGHRIKIPKAIVDTLKIKEGKDVVIKFNLGKKKLTVEIK